MAEAWPHYNCRGLKPFSSNLKIAKILGHNDVTRPKYTATELTTFTVDINEAVGVTKSIIIDN